MKNKNLNQMINGAFVRAHPLKTATAVILFAFGLGMPAAVAYDVKNAMKHEKKSATEVLSERWAAIGWNFLAVWTVVFVCAGFLLDKEQERSAAQYIIKRKIRSLAAKNKKLAVFASDEATVQNFGNLLVANMTKEERNKIKKIAADFTNKISVTDKMYDMEPSNLDRLIAVQEIEKVLNGVFERNPDLIDVFEVLAKSETSTLTSEKVY
ncbi:MAG: hypothetical protein K6B71_01425 [Alphaproteobacteria bacterium]|nr:hypothetical protein [Alphaproteobacteria bacterium]